LSMSASKATMYSTLTKLVINSMQIYKCLAATRPFAKCC